LEPIFSISRERPDVVFLQEVVVKNLAILTSDCPGYRVVVGSPSGTLREEGSYVVAMMLRNDTAVYRDHDVKPFFSSKMARTLLTVEVNEKEFSTSYVEYV